MYTHGTHNFPKKIYFANARLISLIFERKCLLHICMNNIYMLLSTKHLFSKLNGLVDSCHGLKIWHIHFPKGCALVDHGTHISDLSIFVCLQCTHTATKEVRVKHGIAKCLTKGSIELQDTVASHLRAATLNNSVNIFQKDLSK